MMDAVETIVIDEWDDITKLDVGWSYALFRGQQDSRWEPETSLRRAFIRERSRYPETLTETHADECHYVINEYYFIKEFQRRAHHYIDDLPSSEDHVSWLALMQHHGTPTRLLDFTYSFYIAAFFAMIDATADGAVWAITDHFMRDSGCELAGHRGGLREDQLLAQHSFANHYLTSCFQEAKDQSGVCSSRLGVLMLEPERQNLRLGIQQGVLLMPLDTTQSFLKNLTANCSDKHKPTGLVKKYVLPIHRRDDILANLKKMNITAETLFPGIDGYARSIEHRCHY